MPGIYTGMQFAARLRDFPMEARPLIKSLMDVAAEEGEAVSKTRVPVRTGLLQSKIDFRATTNHGWNFRLLAVADTRYASYVEDGTSRMPPRPFIMPGVEHAAAEIEHLLGVMVEEYL